MLDAPWAAPEGGYALLTLLALAIVGARMAPGGLRNRQRAPQRLLATALLLGAALTLLWPTLRSRVMRESQAEPSVERVAGLWVYGVDTLWMDPTGSYRCQGVGCAGFSHRGTWQRSGDNHLVVRWADGHEVTWTMVRYHGRGRLGLSPRAGTGATWSSGLSFMRVTP